MKHKSEKWGDPIDDFFEYKYVTEQMKKGGAPSGSGSGCSGLLWILGILGIISFFVELFE